jgi:hypothetical protein
MVAGGIIGGVIIPGISGTPWPMSNIGGGADHAIPPWHERPPLNIGV